MVKYIINTPFGGMFSFTMPVILNAKGKPDFPAMFKHVKEIVGKDAVVELSA
jgi:hypothetical protein